MHLVDHEVVPGRGLERVVAPVEGGGVVDDRVADRVRQVSRVGVQARHVPAGRADREAVLGAGLDAGDVHGPCPGRPVAVSPELDPVAGPVVERSGDEDSVRVRGPDPERRSPGVGGGTHAGALGGSGAAHDRTIRAAPGSPPGRRASRVASGRSRRSRRAARGRRSSSAFGARVTIDTGVEARTPDGPLVLLAGMAIVETTSAGPPSDADRALWSLGHRPTRVSKFGTSLAAARRRGLTAGGSRLGPPLRSVRRGSRRSRSPR